MTGERAESLATMTLRRRLGSPMLWGFVQAFVAAGFYASLGLVAQRAQGWTWAVYGFATLFFVVTAAAYVEGTSLHQERGGVTVLARYAFDELVSFVAAWAILLDYIILVALTALVATNYLGVFWAPLGEGAVGVLAGVVAVLGVAAINVRGVDPRRFARFFFFALGDLAVQVLVLVLGVLILLEPQVLADPPSVGAGASFEDLVFALPLAVVAFTALDASSGFAGQILISRRGLKRLLGARFASLAIAYVGLAVVATSTVASGAGPESRVGAPMLGVVDAVEQDDVRGVLLALVGVSAALVLFAACVGAMLGLSRLGYSLAVNRQIPSAVGRLHPRFRTPWVVIAVGAVLSIALVSPGDPELLAAIYAFGATLAFAIVHLSVLRLRFRESYQDRPFRIPLNVRLGGYAVPVPSVLGAVMSIGLFASVLVLHEEARIVGAVWMAIGIVLYVVYRTGSEKPLTKRVNVPEETLTRADVPAAEYGSILVPVLGTPLDDDIVQTAGRLAAARGTDELEEGPSIEAMWVFEVPVSLPLDGRLPDSELKGARAALARAKAVGEEYEGVTVRTFTVRARSAGEAIVREARRRGVEAIVMSAEQPTPFRGGVLLGGKEGLHSTIVGETTRYVVHKAPCRVILTAPPDPARRARETAGDGGRPVRRAGRLRRRPAAAAPDGDGVAPRRPRPAD